MNIYIKNKLLLILIILFPTFSFASEGWQWIRVESTLNPNKPEWNVLQGTTDIVFNGKSFTAKLYYDNEKFFLHYVITGTIENGKVKAEEIQLNTDSSKREYSGEYKKIRGYEDEWKIEKITITDGTTYIGLVRGVKK